MKTPAEDILSVLNELGPSLTSTVAKQLRAKWGLSATAARKRIERAISRNEIRSLEGLKLKHNEQFIFTPLQAAGSTIKPSLVRALTDSHSAYGIVLKGIAARGGVLPGHLYPGVSGLPIFKQSGLSADLALEQLEAWGLLQVEQSRLGPCIKLAAEVKTARPSDKRLQGRLVAEELLLFALRDWLRLQGLITSDAGSMRNQQTTPPQFGFFQWDMVAPSYSVPFRSDTKGGPIPGFVVADAILGRRLTTDDVQFFATKCNTIRNQHNNRPFLPFLIADWFEQDAFNLGRKLGLTFTTPKNLLGASFSAALDSVVQFYENKHQVDLHMNRMTGALQTVTHLPNVSRYLKRSLYQFLVAATLCPEDGVWDFDSPLLGPHSNFGDLVIFHPQKLVVVQCKLEDEELDAQGVSTWFQQTTSLLSTFLPRKEKYRHQHLELVLCTSGRFTHDAIELLRALAAKDSDYSLHWIDRESLQVLPMSESCKTLYIELFSANKFGKWIQNIYDE